MKILIIYQYFLEPDGGGGSRFNEMAKSWTDMGHDVTVIAGMMHANAQQKIPAYKGRYFVNRKHGEVNVWRTHVSESYNNGFAGRLWGYFSFVFSSIWAGLFKTKKSYDVILVTSPPLFVGITAYVLSIFKRCPFIFEVRDLWPESAIDTGVVRNKFIIKFAYWFESFIYKKSKLINVLTPAFKKRLIESKKIDPSKIITIPNGADFSISESIINSDFNPESFRVELGWTNKFVITYVGAHGVANHLIQVIEAAELIKNKYPQVQFVLIGSGMQKQKLMLEAEQRNCRNVQFIDPVAKGEVFKYILASDFGASILKNVNTFKTIYSNKTFDYMACKIPIMLAIDGVSRELINSAQCGIYIEPENPSDWVKQIAYCLNLTKEKRIVMGNNGYEYAKKHFDRKKLGDSYINYIENLIKINK